MFAPRVVRLLSRRIPTLRPSYSAVVQERDRHRRCHWITQAESQRRSSSISSSKPRPFIKSTLIRTDNRDVRSRPRYAEDRKCTVDPVLPPEEAIGIVLRPSTREDCPAIYRCLLAQAEWEGCLHLFKITEEDLIKDGFGENPIFHCDVAEAYDKEGQRSIMGYGLYSFSFCAWGGRMANWENLYIHPKYRDLGIGSVFLHEVSKKMYGLGCRVIWGYFDEKEIGLKRWYGSEGYENLTEKHDFHLYSMHGKKLESYIHRDHSNDDYLGKAISRGIQVESIITKKQIY